MTSNMRIQAALDTLESKMELSLPQAAFNLLRNAYLAEKNLRVALDFWADTVLGPEEKGKD